MLQPYCEAAHSVITHLVRGGFNTHLVRGGAAPARAVPGVESPGLGFGHFWVRHAAVPLDVRNGFAFSNRRMLEGPAAAPHRSCRDSIPAKPRI
jgi:hypothetical protein